MSATSRHFLMCPPTHFEVTYAINPWMTLGAPVDTSVAVRQWETLVATYRQLGHTVDLLEPVAGLPDMVFAANGATVNDGIVLGARFLHPERTAEAAEHLRWHTAHAQRLGWREVVTPTFVNEAEGDFLRAGEIILAGWGRRTDRRAHAELARVSRREVVSLELVDPRYYHLDVALFVVDDVRRGVPLVAYYPSAFSAHSLAILEWLYPDAIVVGGDDADVLGLNAVSDGENVVLPAQAEKLAAQVAERGYVPVPVDLSELLMGGGSVKCCTQELRA